jgi:phospholipase/carboxylesterase
MSDETLLPAVEIDPPAGTHRATVIWLHGLGADGHDFEPVVPYLGLDPALGVRFVFPHAPRIPVTLNMGMVMPAWYDIEELDLRRRHDEAGVRRSQGQVEAWIRSERERGIPSERILLAGFSQGGAVALHTALRHPDRLAGVMALSCYLVCDETLETERSAANRDLPVFQAHGTEDPMVPLERGAAARDRLVALGHDVRWSTYPMGHQVHPEEIRHIGEWLAERLR